MNGPRIFIPDLSVHVVQRGGGPITIFGDETDHEVFLLMLEVAAANCGLRVHAFALMLTHFHLLATPDGPRSLPGAMGRAGSRYVRYFNRKYRRTGSLWGGRYRPFPIEDERRWLNCLRYIELNPVRAGVVSRPEEYRWSTYGVHALGHPLRWIRDHPVYTALGATAGERQQAYRAICDFPLTSAELVEQRFNFAFEKRRSSVGVGSDEGQGKVGAASEEGRSSVGGRSADPAQTFQ
jgi:putative transposase